MFNIYQAPFPLCAQLKNLSVCTKKNCCALKHGMVQEITQWQPGWDSNRWPQVAIIATRVSCVLTTRASQLQLSPLEFHTVCANHQQGKTNLNLKFESTIALFLAPFCVSARSSSSLHTHLNSLTARNILRTL